jgi:6-phosphogluconolactonase
MIRLSVHPSSEAAALSAANRLATLIVNAQSERGVAHVSLAGGTTPRRAYELLGPELVDATRVDWWFGDERCVPPDHPDSNYRLVRESLLRAAPIPLERVHRIAGERRPRAAAAAYAEELERLVPANGHGLPCLDVAFLGLGEDGHTASLFPSHPALEPGGELCVAVRAPKPPPSRVSLSLDLLRAARHVVLLASGKSKRDAVAAVLAGPDVRTPASLLGDADVDLIVDSSAAPLTSTCIDPRQRELP